ncbi:flagellar hook capping FlgD N-terminal domain-containing protein [Gorillibacterium sp. sgz5001074]|uniref:flagellar hook capping FlgD N-terminal domain-containing protein n=1 Tax=Gorillibacterium sp. sgz5001074 TaxID=3446695 RepID=UPI003F67CA80
MADSTVSTKNMWPYYSSNNVQKAGTFKGNEMGKDEFLKILIAQLKNQDPASPLQDKEFIAQMAQFTSVEQLSNMAKEMSMLRQSIGMASGLIGKMVSWTVKDSNGLNTTKEGKVDAISFKDGKQYANVKGENVALDQLTKIWDSGAAS